MNTRNAHCASRLLSQPLPRLPPACPPRLGDKRSTFPTFPGLQSREQTADLVGPPELSDNYSLAGKKVVGLALRIFRIQNYKKRNLDTTEGISCWEDKVQELALSMGLVQ